jgi:membrane-bound serine protease (ClpP class)
MKLQSLLLLCLCFLLMPLSGAKAENCTPEISITGMIGPATILMLERGLEKAASQKCPSLLVLINTPGGSLQTTRVIVEKIVNSPVPVLCLVSPPGGHAGSAGAIILQACHVNGAMATTNIGAATPISAMGEDIPEDLKKKLFNDTLSWMDGLTTLRGRSKEFGREIVTEAKAVSAEEAKKIGAIDYVAAKKMDFLNFAEGRPVTMTEGKTENVKVGDLIPLEPGLRDHFLALFADPQIAYLLLMGSLALLYFEITHPGSMVAGVVGGVGLVLALVALERLNVEWGGLMLLLLGLGLLIAEAFLPSFGVLGVGGIASFILGSLFLFDPEKSGGYQLPTLMVTAVAGAIGFIMLGLAFLSFRTLGLKPKWGGDEMVGREARVVEVDAGGHEGQLEVLGEVWKFESPDPIVKDQKVFIQNIKGLTLTVTGRKES